MHRNRIFQLHDRATLLEIAAELSFAHVFAQTTEGPRLAHAAVIVTPEGALRFHLARGNALTPHLDSAAALIGITGPDAYISPDWYVSADQVPTWNYIAIECEGPIRRLDEAETVALLDDLSAAHEARLAPKRPWTRHKMTPGAFEKKLPAIVGFEMAIETLRGTAKFSQNKSPEDIAGAIAGLEAQGQHKVAELMRRFQREDA